MTSPTPMLYYSNSSDPNFLHASKFSAPDNMICLVLKDKTLLYASDLEFGRAKQQSSCTVVSLSDYDEQKTIGDKIAKILSENGVTALYVTESFSCKLFEELSKSVQVKVFEGQIGERRAKTASEIENIKLANNASVASYKMIQQILRESTIGENDVLMYKNSVLTCEYLQQQVEITCILNNANSLETIVACGIHGTDPHCHGYGPVYAHQLIVCDIYPRHKSNYFGDMTRTFLKGTPTEAQTKLYETVLQVHDECINMSALNVSYKSIADHCMKKLAELGYEKKFVNGTYVGMMHGLGHGVSLEIHEEPRVNTRSESVIEKGDVFTIEPGLYYPEIGMQSNEYTYYQPIILFQLLIKYYLISHYFYYNSVFQSTSNVSEYYLVSKSLVTLHLVLCKSQRLLFSSFM
ncbi:Xaa-Pro_aminopeptidase [Hexamita inflata]|uniref:Xaa-Pro aminopeptidase n=1 Tax=Hexamita inflata TaxID=28002 RepID=A0AA86QNP9_9EUKA|nr:Xaa-Pro aminopeptidase [Hexamita inflata]